MNDLAVGRLADAVATLQTELNRADRAIANELAVGSAEDLQILRLLLAEGPIRIGELAERRASSKTTASSRISRLEQKGLVTRARIPGDLRAMIVSLTKAGEDAANRSREQRWRQLEPIADDFQLETIDKLVAALQTGPDRR